MYEDVPNIHDAIYPTTEIKELVNLLGNGWVELGIVLTEGTQTHALSYTKILHFLATISVCLPVQGNREKGELAGSGKGMEEQHDKVG